jgi:hypothetical protein
MPPSIDDLVYEPIGDVTYTRLCPERCDELIKVFQPAAGERNRINERYTERRCQTCGRTVLGVPLPRRC